MSDIAMLCRLANWIEREAHIKGINVEVQITALIDKLRYDKHENQPR